MHLEINYADWPTERLCVFLDGFRTASRQNWMPGHVVGSSSARCGMDRDFFETSMGEEGLRSGAAGSESDDFEPFLWTLVGDEADECAAMLERWEGLLGTDFDPDARPPRELDPVLALEYRSDQRCWWEWLDDPAATLGAIRARSASPLP